MHLWKPDLKVEGEKVDWNGVFASVVLKNSSEESLSEVEARHPEDNWFPINIPPLQHQS